MAFKQWEALVVHYCDNANCEVTLEVEKVYPAEHLPDQPSRIIAHRCSNGIECGLFDRPTCVWAGTNPSYDPFAR
ncbi:MAG TPA: hypothetical protein VFF68_00360 [Anaerolineaceae bacterium]|nr:hypothetical protein [Anaerolineaceae bacterium]